MRGVARGLAVVAMLLAARPLAAQNPPQPPAIDTIMVEGNARITADQVVLVSGLFLHSRPAYRDIQRAIKNLFATGQFDDVRIEERHPNDLFGLAIIVRERPLLRGWEVTGARKLPAHEIRALIRLLPGRPVDRVAVARSEYSIDSLYKKEGFYGTRIEVKETPTTNQGVQLAFEISEGSRVVISRVEIEGNTLPAKEIVAALDSKPEGFWWFRDGEYDERKVDADARETLPQWYGRRGRIDFQTLGDTLIPDPRTGKAILRFKVEEGKEYHVGTFEILGNHRFSTQELANYFPFGTYDDVGSGKDVGGVFDRTAWQDATSKVEELYQNSGYINPGLLRAEQSRRTLADGTPVVDLRWRLNEGQPATINKINIVGNEVTHERVIREAIVLLPGEVFNRERLVRSYQNISNLGYFQQPLPNPDVVPAANGVDVDITFRVEEKHTGNINFGASVGQGTGLGGFLGLEEPNLFGRGKRGRLQWQFGQNITDFQLSYTDPAIHETRLSGTVNLYDSQLRYVIGDLGRTHQGGGSLQLGLPFLGSRYSRLFASYGFQRISYSEGSATIQARYNCSPCTRSTLGLSFVRDTRIGLPFPIAGSMVTVNGEQDGGPLGGDGNYQKLDLDTRWFAPLGKLGGKSGGLGGGIQFTLGLTAKSGFIFGDPGGFFTQLYSMGGVQYGIPLRGYSEFSITPNGYDAHATTTSASADAFGKSYAAFTLEAGARLSQSIYLSTFLDAGNVYRSARQYDPTRLYRGAGFGVALISPLGPIGLDLAYGFDKTDLLGHPAPGWQLHFRLGNFF